MILAHKIQEINFANNSMILCIDGKELRIELDAISEKLKAATAIQRSFYTISPSGYGIHWPLIDEDLSVEAILKQLA